MRPTQDSDRSPVGHVRERHICQGQIFWVSEKAVRVGNMNNHQVAETLIRIGDLLDIKGESIHKVLAYRRAAESIEELGEDVNDYQREGKLAEIPGVGKALTEKLNELLTTGHLGYLDNLEKEVPPSLLDLLAVPGIGTKTVRLLWEKLGITTLSEAEAAARAGRLRSLPGLGVKSETKILSEIESARRENG